MAKKSKIRLKAGASVGQPAAEDDIKFLNECFINHPVIDALTDVASHQCLLLGRTGAGKSAILWHIEKALPHVSCVDPKDVAFEYIGNSPVIRHLTALGVDLHILYEYLWTHVLTLHFIRECLGVRSTDSLSNVLASLRELVWRDKKREIAINYLEKYANNFWITVEEVSAEVANTISQQLAGEAGISTQLFEAKIVGGSDWKDEEKRLFKYRAQQAISRLQMRELKEAINALAERVGKNNNNYVLIDNLDGGWGGDGVTQYALIRALIESLKTFRRIPNLKIIVAMREDLYEATIRATADKHFQPEKLEGIIARLRWNEGMLGTLIERRIQQLFRYEYMKQSVALTDVLPANIGRAQFRSYLIDHTLWRPRDVIAFVNRILSENEGEALPLSSRAVTKAEPGYSNGRRDALEIEWRSCHPLVKSYLHVIQGLAGSNLVESVDEDKLFALAYEVSTLDRPPVDEVERLAISVYERDKEQRFKKLARALVACLYKIGAIGIKLHASQQYMYCYEQRASIGEGEILESARFIVHPMLMTALGGWPSDVVEGTIRAKAKFA